MASVREAAPAAPKASNSRAVGEQPTGAQLARTASTMSKMESEDSRDTYLPAHASLPLAFIQLAASPLDLAHVQMVCRAWRCGIAQPRIDAAQNCEERSR